MKTTKEKIEVMEAFEEGKKIEFKNIFGNWELAATPRWNWETNDYRVKVESKYRAYKDTEELINDFCERFGVIRKSWGEPFIWISWNAVKWLVDGISENLIFSGSNKFSMEYLFDNCTYCDGSPCGKRI